METDKAAVCAHYLLVMRFYTEKYKRILVIAVVIGVKGTNSYLSRRESVYLQMKSVQRNYRASANGGRDKFGKREGG